MSNIHTILMSVKAMLATRETWTAGALVRNKEGRVLDDVGHPGACQWCLIGAVSKISRQFSTPGATFNKIVEYLSSVALMQTGYTELVHVNDHIGFEGVHKLLDTGIERTSHLSRI